MKAERRTGPGAALLPGLRAIRDRDGAALRGDLFGGVTVAAYLIPQVLAYAELAGMPAVVGLWAAGVSLLVYPLFGSSRQLSVGPESTTALMTAVALAPLAAGQSPRYLGLAATLALLVGVICLLARLARLGFLADLLSRPVLIGYLAGVAVTMMVSQIRNLTGIPATGTTILNQLRSLAGNLDQLHLPTLLTGTAVLAFLLIGGWLMPHAPIPLIGVLLAAGAAAVLNLPERGLQVVGAIPTGLPTPGLPSGVGVADVSLLLLPAFGLAVVGYSDNVLTGRAFASRSGHPIDANQELTGLGAANLASGLCAGFPVSCSASRTVIGDAMGSRSQLHSLVAVAVLLVVLLVGGPVLAAFPSAALGALVVYAAMRLIDLPEFRRIARFRRSELVIALATVAAVLALGVLYGVLAAIGLSILDLLRRVSRPHDGILGYAPGVAGMHDIDDYPHAAVIPGLLVYRYDAPLCFANAENFRQRALDSLASMPAPTEWFLLNAEANVDIDLTAADALAQLHEELQGRGITFAMARVKQELRADLDTTGLVTRIGEDLIFPTLPTAVEAYRAHYTAAHGAPPPPPLPPFPTPG